MRFVTKRVHAYLDYPVALALMALPFVLGLGESHAAAQWLSIGTGVAALILTLLTDHHLGVVRVLPYKFHLFVDFLVAIVFIAAPLILGFQGIDAGYYWANGGAVLTVIALHRPEEGSAESSAFASA
ncbi:MAG: hypothetical protein AAF517_13995 [Planctomycetota bacterium]